LTESAVPSNPAPSRATADTRRFLTGFLTLETVETALLFLLFLSCATPYRFDIDRFQVSLTEIFAWLFVLWRAAAGGSPPIAGPAVRWLRRGLWAIAAWSAVVFALSANWNLRRDMVIEWLLAALVFESLMRSPVLNWKRIAGLLIIAALPNVILGWQQHVTGIGLAPKDFFGWSKQAEANPVFGFFGHSNDLAVFLYWPFLLAFGLALRFRSWSRTLFAGFAVLCGFVLIWTVSRSIFFTLAAVGLLLLALVLLPRKNIFLGLVAGGISLAVIIARYVWVSLPIREINQFLSGRLNLWSQTWRAITADPLFLPLGYLSVQAGKTSIFWIPHNIYLLAWVEFGWFGVLLLAGLAAYFLVTGWNRYARLRQFLPAAVLWLGFAGQFLINGLDSLYLQEIHVVIGFICIAALWISMLREMDGSQSPGPQVTAEIRK
jgi:hypothetical protein